MCSAWICPHPHRRCCHRNSCSKRRCRLRQRRALPVHRPAAQPPEGSPAAPVPAEAAPPAGAGAGAAEAAAPQSPLRMRGRHPPLPAPLPQPQSLHHPSGLRAAPRCDCWSRPRSNRSSGRAARRAPPVQRLQGQRGRRRLAQRVLLPPLLSGAGAPAAPAAPRRQSSQLLIPRHPAPAPPRPPVLALPRGRRAVVSAAGPRQSRRLPPRAVEGGPKAVVLQRRARPLSPPPEHRSM